MSISPEHILCPHCGAESKDDDDLCRFCGKAMVATVAQERGCCQALRDGLRALGSHVRPMTTDELEKYSVAPTNLSLADPSDPTHDDW